jgi:hypothetical protein
MKIYSQDGSELLEVNELGIDGSQLVIKGRAFGSMPMSARLRPAEARKLFGLLTPRLVGFLLTFLFRR